MLATRLAGRLVVPAGRDARPSRANVRHPAAAQLPTAQPFVLDGLPGTTPRRPRSVAGWGRAFGACCFAGKLRSPAGPGREPPWPGQLTPTSFSTSTPTSFPTRWGGVPLVSLTEHIGAGQSPLRGGRPPPKTPRGVPPWWGQSAAKPAADWPPSGGVVRPRRVVRFARLIHRRVRALGVPSARAAFAGISYRPGYHVGWCRMSTVVTATVARRPIPSAATPRPASPPSGLITPPNRPIQHEGSHRAATVQCHRQQRQGPRRDRLAM
jgi:hypothetical protein